MYSLGCASKVTRRVNARFAARHTHDFQNRLAVEFVVEPVLVCEEKI